MKHNNLFILDNREPSFSNFYRLPKAIEVNKIQMRNEKSLARTNSPILVCAKDRLGDVVRLEV